jgi:hypothetical protein
MTAKEFYQTIKDKLDKTNYKLENDQLKSQIKELESKLNPTSIQNAIPSENIPTSAKTPSNESTNTPQEGETK